MSDFGYQASIDEAAARAIARKAELRGGPTLEQPAGPDVVRIVADELGRTPWTTQERRELTNRCIPSEPAAWPPRIVGGPDPFSDGGL